MITLISWALALVVVAGLWVCRAGVRAVLEVLADLADGISEKARLRREIKKEERRQ